MRIRVACLLPIVALCLASCAGNPHSRAPDGPVTAADSLVSGPGLVGEALVITDRHGIPHIRAANLADLYWAWGYVTARDRLWQLEISRRAGRGRMWEWFGNGALRDDGGAQLLELGERSDRIWERERLDPAVGSALEAYAAGINAFIARCERGESAWPPEFRHLVRTAAPWRPADSILLLFGQAMVLDFALPEIGEADTLRHLGLDAWRRRERFESRVTYHTVPDSAAERMYRARSSRASRNDDHGGSAASGRRPAAPAPFAASAGVEARRALGRWFDDGPLDPDDRASNVFAVGPGRAARGHALFANDPHLPLGAPSPLHVVHLSVPGVVEAAGAAVPGLPAIVSGRNRGCAWGITALGADVIDVYADTLSHDGRSVKHGGAWTPLVERPFTMRYRLPWGSTVPVAWAGQRRRYSPHGPVVIHDAKNGVAYSVRWAPRDSSITLRGMLGVERLAGAREVAAAFRTLALPTLNVVAADVRGDVVYQAVGAVPRRGFVPNPGPLPGDGRHEWGGLIAPEDMPAWRVPRGGIVVNANNTPVGPAYGEPWPRFDWLQDRALRIAERLEGDPSVTLDDMRSVQNDVVSRAAARLVPLMLRAADSLAAGRSPRASAALDTLRAWDFTARRDRVGPTLFRAWYGAFLRRSRCEDVPGLAYAVIAGETRAEPRAPGGGSPEPVAVAASAALDTAITRLTGLLGPDPATWTWGRAHRARFRHRLAATAPDFRGPEVAMDGDNSTPSVGRSSLPWNITVTHGPAFRHLVDLGVADTSWAVIPPGNSGVPASGYDRNLLATWRDHRYVPLVLGWERVRARGGAVTRLVPAPNPADQ